MRCSPLRLRVQVPAHPPLHPLHFQAVEAQEYGHTPMIQKGGKGLHERVQMVELPVHRNAQRLKQSCTGGLGRMPPGGERSVHAVRQIQGSLERPLLPAVCNGIHDMFACSQGLSGILREDGHETALVQRVDQVRSGHSLRLVIAHIQKPVLLETESPACSVDVHAVKPEIQ